MNTPDKGSYPHFLIKEIYEQPAAVRGTMLAHVGAAGQRVVLPGARLALAGLEQLRRITIAASGSSRHAGLAGRVMIEELAGIPVDVDYASEVENRNPCGLGELTIVITQSGETADALSALRRARTAGSRTLAITNVPGSPVSREADGVLYTHAGPEISIPATKSFTTQLAVLFLFAVYLAEARGALEKDSAHAMLHELLALPEKIQNTLGCAQQCSQLARTYSQKQGFMFLGRGIHCAAAMDGALKLKETACIQAEGFPAGEIKHGPYALVDAKLAVVAMAARDPRSAPSHEQYQRVLADIAEIREQGAPVLAVATRGDQEILGVASDVVFVPSAPELLLPLLEIVPLQLFACYIGLARHCNVDQPRNLVKAVVS